MNNTQQNLVFRRLRDFYMYTTDGVRLVDCYLANGHAVLGHKPKNLANALKQTVEKGIWGELLTRETKRTLTHLNKYLSPWKICALVSKHELSLLFDMNNVTDLLTCENENLSALSDSLSTNKAIIWRPFSNIQKNDIINISVDYVITPVPFSWGNGIFAVYSRTHDPALSIHCSVSTMALGCINYIIPYLIEKGTNIRPPITVAKNRTDLFLIDTNIVPSRGYQHATINLPATWKRKGIYVHLPFYDYTEYAQIQAIFLSKGFFISPPSSPFPSAFSCVFSDKICNIQTPYFFTLPPYMTAHEITQWNLAVQTVSSF